MRKGYRLGHAAALDGNYRDGFTCGILGEPMGMTAEYLAEHGEKGRRLVADMDTVERVVRTALRLAHRRDLIAAPTPADATGTWFRLHHLLRDLLRVELARTSPDRAAELHAAAGRWHVEAGDLMPAIEHFLRAGRRVEAADLVADNATVTFHDSDKELVGQGVGNIAAGLFGGIGGAGATIFVGGRRAGAAARVIAWRNLPVSSAVPPSSPGSPTRK